MRMILSAVLLGALITNGAVAGNGPVTAKGTLYVTYNMGVGSESERELSARFVPDGATFSAPVGSPEPMQPVRHFNIDNPSGLVDALLGQAEMTRLSKDLTRIVAMSVTAVLSHRRRVVECDAPADYATLMSAKALERVHPVSRDVAPVGC
jgi:hypothetical protein